MWCYQAMHDRNTGAQYHATHQLPNVVDRRLKKAAHVCKSLQRIVKDHKQFWRVQEGALLALPGISSRLRAEDANKIALEQAAFLMDRFQDKYGIPSQQQLPRTNDFSDIKEYFVMRALLRSLGKLRTAGGIVPTTVYDFLVEVLHLNDNTNNRFDDGYYLGTLIEATAACVDGIPSPAPKRSSKSAASGPSPEETAACTRRTAEILHRITHHINRDKLVPSFQYAVTRSGLRALHKLQASKTVPFQREFFHNHALYGHDQQVRRTAIEIIAANSRSGSQQDLNFLLELAENDYCPNIRSYALEAIVTSKSVSSDLAVDDESILKRVWGLMNMGSAYEVSVRIASLNLFRENFRHEGTKLVVENPDAEIKIGLKLAA